MVSNHARKTAQDNVVRPMARAGARPCARPGCPAPARSTLSFRYDTREAWLESLADESSPATYDLCGPHASRTRPPHGWSLVDKRPDEPDTARADSAELGGSETVALLAAALRGGNRARTRRTDTAADPDGGVAEARGAAAESAEAAAESREAAAGEGEPTSPPLDPPAPDDAAAVATAVEDEPGAEVGGPARDAPRPAAGPEVSEEPEPWVKAIPEATPWVDELVALAEEAEREVQSEQNRRPEPAGRTSVGASAGRREPHGHDADGPPSAADSTGPDHPTTGGVDELVELLEDAAEQLSLGAFDLGPATEPTGAADQAGAARLW